MLKLRKLGYVILLLLFVGTAQADWVLDSESSRLDFVSVKKGKIGEVHQFKKLSGAITQEGAASIIIDLASVETHIESRNKRMKELLLEIGTYPQAAISAQLDPVQLLVIKAGQRTVVPVNLIVELHGKKKELQADMLIVGLSGQSLMVSPVRPIILNAFDFDLDVGIQKLLEVAKLPSISSAVPVTFSLVYIPK